MSRSRHSCLRCSRLPSHHSRNRHREGEETANRDHHLKQNAGNSRRHQTPLFLLLVDYQMQEELEILKVKVPDAPEKLTQQVVEFVQHLRNRDLFKLPGVAETIDWTNALIQLDKIDLDPETVNSSLGVLLKYQDDIERVQGSEAAQILDEVKAGISAGT